MGTFIGADAATSTAGTPSIAWAGLGSWQALDVAVGFVFHSSLATATTPSGWTKIGGYSAGGLAFCDIYTHTLTGSESGSIAFTCNTGSAAKADALVEVHRGKVEPTSAEVSTFTAATSNTAQSQAVPALAHAGTIRWVTATGLRNSTPPTTFTVPAGTTLGDSGFTTGGGAMCASVAHSTAEESDGNVGSGNWQHNTAAAVDWVTVTVALVDPVTTVAGGVCPITLTALAGTVVAGGAVTVSGGVCAITATALAGTVIAGGPVTVVGKLSTLTLTAPKGLPAPASADVVAAISYPAVAAHRGGAGVKPQETLVAYTYAAGLSDSVALEMDVQVNASGSLVLWHDSDVSAVGVNSSGVAQSGNVVDKTDSDWNALCVKWPAGFTGPPPAAAAYWREIVAGYRNSGRVLVPEIKATAAGAPLVASIVANGMQGQCIVQSFDASDLTQVVAAGIDALLLDDTPDYSAMSAAGIGHVGIDYTVVTGTQVTNAHAAGIKVWCYLPNTTSARDSLLAIGVDGFITNKPATLLPNFVDGETAAVTLTALAGTVDARRAVTVAGGVAALTVTAPAGTLDARRAATVVGGVASVTVTAQPGAVLAAGAVTVSGLPVTITTTARVGAVATGVTVTGQTATITLTTPAGQVITTQGATVAGLTAAMNVQAHAGLVVLDAPDPGTSLGRILHARLRIDDAHGELRIPAAHGHARIPAARGELR